LADGLTATALDSTRVADVDAAALADFLGSHPPFDVLAATELSQLARQAVVERYSPGSVILDAFDSSVDELFVVWEGRVDVWSHRDRLTELPDRTEGVGGLFGYVAALTRAAVGPQAVAVGEVLVVRLPADLVAPAFASRRGARFLAQEVYATSQQAVGVPTYTLVNDLIERPPLVVEPGTSIADAASRMVAADLGYTAVRLPEGGYGLVTDATIRRVVAAGRQTSTPVAAVMTLNPPTVPLGASATEALIKILEAAADFVLVVDRTGLLRGVVAPIDFVVSSTTAGAALHEQLRRATTVDELQQRFRLVPELVGDLMARGLASSRVIRVHSALVDTLTRRAIQLVMESRPDLNPDAFTWLSLGSNGRREGVLNSDMDAAAAFADELSAAEIDGYLPALAAITDVLVGAGVSHDRHGVSPANPAFAPTHREWERAAKGWLSKPTEGDAIIMTCLLVDGRPIYGDFGLPEVARVFGDLRHHPTTMRMLLAISVDRSDALRGRWRRRAINIKTQALLPIANIARWAALSVESSALATPERLRAAAGTRMMSTEDADTLGDVFAIAQRVRLRHQLEQLGRGETPSDTIGPRDMSTVEASVLTEAIREILAVQRRMANKADYVPELGG